MGVFTRSMVLGMMLLAILLVACTPELPQDTGTPERARTTVPEREIEAEPPAPTARLPEEIAALITKGEQAEGNYNYRFDAQESTGYKVFVKGALIKKVYSEAVRLRQDINYDTVYLNVDERTAYGTCASTSISCDPAWKKYFALPFAEQEPDLTPLDVLAGIPATAVKVGSENFDNRAATIIEYENAAGRIVRVSIDTFYGLPLKMEEYDVQGDEKTLRKKHTFTQLSAGNVKSADVTLPGEYELLDS